MINRFYTDVLVVGGGTGGVAAALQAARRGANTILVSEFTWLGGMLTSAGVSAPDGNELIAFQTGIWGAFLKELKRRHPQGLDWGWVSFFTFDPRVGAEIFADWVSQEPNLHWISGDKPQEVLKQNNKVTGVRFSNYTVEAEITVDATELGDLLALGEIPHRWGWELQTEWEEPSAPVIHYSLTKASPIQAPTWVAILRDFGENTVSPEIPAPPIDNPDQFAGAWEGYGVEQFLNYGRLPGGLMMINWPCRGNDYGEGLNRLIQSPNQQQEFFRESRWHTQSFLRFIQQQLGRRYGLAAGIFPLQDSSNETNSLETSFALHPYYRESRRLQGLTTIREQDILAIPGGKVAALPINYTTGLCDAIAIGNYPNDHHYTQELFPLKLKYLRWGGRWTGTPFTIPYRALIPQETEGLLVCEKNISVSHIANGATRLQPVVLGIGQAAGMAAALCVESRCQPRSLSVRQLQEELLQEPTAPAAVIPLFNLPLESHDWVKKQRYYLQHPEAYPASGYCDLEFSSSPKTDNFSTTQQEELTDSIEGIFHRRQGQDYTLKLTFPEKFANQTWTLVTLDAEIDRQFQDCENYSLISLKGRMNEAGHWFIVEALTDIN
ncbi:MAG: FAD-dependent oxidoreductase [Cyanobacteriota bacterium]|nr:FAD-dependent oxidoreductase [Cyanobacteriota bacterium]